MAAGIAFNTFKKKLLEAGINFTVDDIKLMLLSNAFSPNIDTQEFKSHIDANELATSGGYTAGGVSLASKTVTNNMTSDIGVLDATDPSWAADGTGFTARYAVLYKNTGDRTTSPLIAYWDFGSDQTPISTTFTLVISTAGIINLA